MNSRTQKLQIDFSELLGKNGIKEIKNGKMKIKDRKSKKKGLG